MSNFWSKFFLNFSVSVPETLQSGTQEMEVSFQKIAQVEKLAYQELDCDYVPSY